MTYPAVLRRWQGTRGPPRSESEGGHSSTITSSAAAPKQAVPFSFPRSWVKKQVWSIAAGLTSTKNTFLGSSILWTRAVSEAEVRLTSRSAAVDSSARPTHPSDSDRVAQEEPAGAQQLTGCPRLAMAPGSICLYGPAPPGAHLRVTDLVAFIPSFIHSFIQRIDIVCP